MIAVIPARFASTRFPGKPLAHQTGKFLIQHVYERVSQCASIDEIIVATDDERIVAAVESFGGSVVMTRSDHRSGTDRVAEVAAAMDLSDRDVVLNVQGDEPEIDSDVLVRLVERLSRSEDGCRIATAAAPFDEGGPREGAGSPLDPACVKVVVSAAGRAMYFSRSLLPYLNEHAGRVDRPSRWLLHLGVYAFFADTLRAIATEIDGVPSPLEQAESLEQLRWLGRGWPMAVEVVKHRCVGIDTPEDYAAFVARTGACRDSPTSRASRDGCSVTPCG